MPKCPADCTCAHKLQIAMVLLGVGRTKLYQMMSTRTIAYVDAGYGRRIRHDVIKTYLDQNSIQ